MTQVHQSERQDRIQRLESIIKQGIEPYPARCDKEPSPINGILEKFEAYEQKGKPVAIAGRIMSKREHGALLFMDCKDQSGSIQLYLKRDLLGEANFSFAAAMLDMGDFILAQGTPVTTKRGEKSILIKRLQLLTKSIRPLPEKWHGLSDIETRFRKRELDLLSNAKVNELFILRSMVLKAIRGFFEKNNFIEVETPILQTVPGGAAARPFITHHAALDQDMYLRIAPELYLKRLVVGGYERVFEIARCFRNEGIDTQHNPEFTQVEAYAAFFDYEKLMSLVEKMIITILKECLHSHSITYQKHELQFEAPFRRQTYRDCIKQYTDIDIANASDDDLKNGLAKAGGNVQPEWERGKILDELFKKIARPKIIQPLFLTHHPIELSPLAKQSKDKRFVERFQLIIEGMEIVNGFSELNDPLEQAKRFAEQDRLRQKGDDEAQYSDTLFVESLEYGLPPTAGLGFGIDRFLTLLTDTENIKEVILFPTLRNKEI